MKKYRPKKQLWDSGKTQKSGRVIDKNNGRYWKIYDIKLFGRDKHSLLKVLEDKLASGTKKYWIATVNPEFVMSAQKDVEFKNILDKTNINVVDGIGLIWARELSVGYQTLNPRFIKKLLYGVGVGVEVLKGKYKDQVASGADLISDLVKLAARDNKKVFFLGGWGNRAELTANYFKSQGENIRCEWSSGEPTITNDKVIKQINQFKPDILFVAYGMKRQEFWINDNLSKIDVGLVMGVGRSFDYYSGELRRAPGWVRKMGMEWLYSLIKEPKRFKRQLVLPKFCWKILNN